MSKQSKELARRWRTELMDLLGPVCAACGTTEDLTFDCVKPVGDEHHRGSTDQRMCFYRYQHFEHANCQVLCRSCNSQKAGDDTDYRTPHPDFALVDTSNPF